MLQTTEVWAAFKKQMNLDTASKHPITSASQLKIDLAHDPNHRSVGRFKKKIIWTPLQTTQ